MTITRADSVSTLRMSRTRDLGAPLYIPAKDLEPGDQIRDRGALRTITKVDLDDRPHACVVVHMANGAELGIAPEQRVYAWRH